MYDDNFDDMFDYEDDGRFIKFVKKFGTSFILTISALISMSFYVVAGSSIFSWMPQEWMSILAAVILGITGNEGATSFWLSVRQRAKNLTETQATIVQGGIGAGAITSTLTTLAAFIIDPSTSPDFLARYAGVVAFVMMSLPVIIQTLLVMGFLSFSREAEVSSKKAKSWGENLTQMVNLHDMMTKATLREKTQEVRRQLPAHSQQLGKHGANKLIEKGKSQMMAEQEGQGQPPQPLRQYTRADRPVNFTNGRNGNENGRS